LIKAISLLIKRNGIISNLTQQTYVLNGILPGCKMDFVAGPFGQSFLLFWRVILRERSKAYFLPTFPGSVIHRRIFWPC